MADVWNTQVGHPTKNLCQETQENTIQYPPVFDTNEVVL
jgi:hypothetical protein